MLLGILFNVCLVASNLLETKVIQIGPIIATAGLIVFPISYIINDCIAEVWGFKKARLIIWSGFAMNFLTIGFARLAIVLPAAPFWEGEDSFNFVFGLAPRIAIASLLAFLVGSFLNASGQSGKTFFASCNNFHTGGRKRRFAPLLPHCFRRIDSGYRPIGDDRHASPVKIPL